MDGWHHALLVVLWTFPFLAGAILLCRMIAIYLGPPKEIGRERKFNKPLYERLSTYLLLAAFIASIVNTALCLDSTNHGLGERQEVISEKERLRATKSLFICQAFGIVGASLARISVAFYELHLFRSIFTHSYQQKGWLWRQLTNHKSVLWLSIGTQVVVNSACLIQVYVQCTPAAKWWDPNLPGFCLDHKVHVVFGFVQGGINTCTVLTLSLVPALKLSGLKVMKLQRLAISGLLGIGVIDAVSSIVKTVLIGRLAAPFDPLYRISPLVIAWTIEQYLAIICGSVPYLPQLHKRWQGGSKNRLMSQQQVYGSFASQETGEHSIFRFERRCSRRDSDGTWWSVSKDRGWHIAKTLSEHSVNYNGRTLGVIARWGYVEG